MSAALPWLLQVPAWWPWLVLVPLGAALAAWLGHRANGRVQAELGRREAELCGRRRHRRGRATLAALALCLFVLALLRPVGIGPAARIAPDVVLCVDVSRSMAAGDVAPSRFAALREQLKELLRAATGARFGLVAFAGSARLVAPLTADRDAVDWLLGELEPGAMALGAGTDLGAAIGAARDVFAGAGAIGEIVVLTDGEHFGNGVEPAVTAARGVGHRVHAVGYGSPQGSKIAVQDGDRQVFVRDAAGNDVITRCDVATLSRLASLGGGRFAHAVRGDELQQLWRDELRPAAARQLLRAGGDGVVERYPWPLALALLLWLLRMVLPERSR